MRRGDMTLNAWISMLDLLISGTQSAPNSIKTLTDFVDWFEVSRQEGRMVDVGMFRHFIDPMKPFAESLRPHLHGVAMTSATLKAKSQPSISNTQHSQQIVPSPSSDASCDDWAFADLRMGSNYLNEHGAPHKLSLSSPYDYAKQTEIIIIDDLNKNDGDAVSAAFRELFLASNGGGLGVFTSIQRLKYVQNKILSPLTAAQLPLYTQHVDEMDIGTLIDMFREDAHSCLLGTDAVRDGVDVPGDALRLLIFDRVPWPRPSILHRQRKQAFGQIMGSPRAYDEALTRLKLKQAYGRLIRSESDKGVFVMLDSALPSRLHDAFPPDVQVKRLPLSEACMSIKLFLAQQERTEQPFSEASQA
jgi:ATP-dependent DNA helicase DinG